jgi:galactokinase
LALLPGGRLDRRVRHLVTENTRVLAVVELLSGPADLRLIGPLLTQSHLSLRDDYEVSCAERDLAVDAALAAGAHGARMTGGGFGGSAIALVDTDRAEETALSVGVAFARAGLTAPEIFPVRPSPGAHRAS